MTPITEERLREALESFADQVVISPDAYEHAQAEWRRRERRRRIRVIVIAIVIIALADAIGLWALNQARSGSPVLFNGPAREHAHPGRISVPPAGVVILSHTSASVSPPGSDRSGSRAAPAPRAGPSPS